jgi:hypothetical protein
MKLKAKTPRGAANELAKFLRKKFSNAAGIRVLSPDEGMHFFGSKSWMVCYEEGPFEWAPSLSGGSSIYAGETGSYGSPGDFPQGLCNQHVWGECQNNFAICFYKQGGVA